MDPLKALIIADSTVDPIIPLLADRQAEPAIAAACAPYAQVAQVLLAADHQAWDGQPQLAAVWTRPEYAIPAFSDAVDGQPPRLDRIFEEVDAFAAAVAAAASRGTWMFVLSWALPATSRPVQGLTLRHDAGVANVLMQMNLRLAEQLHAAPNTILLDVQYWHARLDRPAHDAKMAALGRILYSRDFLALAAQEIKAVARAAFGAARKLLVCDLDNTLWGGIVGDDGMAQLKLGGHDPAGECFASVQRSLKRLKNRGILLAICSKNEEDIALEAIDQLPEMALRREDFVAWRINWQDKAANIAEICAELNLGLHSTVFLDDNPAERSRVRESLPEVLVPELPGHWIDYPAFVSQLDCFEAVELTDEDARRTELYQERRQSNESRKLAGPLEDWLASLGLEVQVQGLDRSNLPRAAQLLNKTNQFNMSTRRLNEEAFWEWAHAPSRTAMIFRVADRFGDQGICGVVSTDAPSPEGAQIVDFVMSCRVMGKQVEDAMLYTAARHLRRGGCERARTQFHETRKNKPFARFIEPKLAGNGEQWLDLQAHKLPAHVALKGWEEE